jgi:polysaccharide export outer membrane protein
MAMSRPTRQKPLRAAAAALLVAAGLAGCASLPHDGPSTPSVRREASQKIPAGPVEAGGRYALVDLTYAVTQVIATNPPAPLAGLGGASSDARNDLIGEGDQLSVSVFEPGANGLFGSAVAQASQGRSEIPLKPDSGSTAGANPAGTGSSETLPALEVDINGDLLVPFAGQIHVAGLTAADAATAIRKALHGRAIDPQVTVAVITSRANSVSVLGEVRQPGRFLLATHDDRLLDLLAQAGGPIKPAPDLALAIYRGTNSVEVPLSLLMEDPHQNIRLAPEDRIVVLDRPRTYSTFGAIMQNGNVPMLDSRITLADALAKGGGLNTFSANGKEVLLFRFERPEVAKALGVTLPPAAKGVPIVYKLNFRESEGMFVANNFDIQPEDMVYVPVSDITEAKKFFDLVNSVTQIGYNARITTGATP